MAGAFAVGIWMYLEFSGVLQFLNIFQRFHLGWLIGILVFVTVGRFYEMRVYWKREISEINAGFQADYLAE